MGDFRRAFHQPQFADEIGGVDDLAETGELVVEKAGDTARHAVGVVFDSDSRA
jgi:hypothetical protein